jgi:hypothetical protein
MVGIFHFGLLNGCRALAYFDGLDLILDLIGSSNSNVAVGAVGWLVAVSCQEDGVDGCVGRFYIV